MKTNETTMTILNRCEMQLNKELVNWKTNLRQLHKICHGEIKR